jgi:ferredoxin
MRRRHLPELDHNRCRGSGRCIAVCPTDALDLWNDRPLLLRPDACLSCGACVLVCPTNAISIPSWPNAGRSGESDPPGEGTSRIPDAGPKGDG